MGFMMWILTQEKAFRILMYVGAFGAVGLFGLITSIFIYLRLDLILIIIMGVAFLLSLWKLIKILRNRKLMGSDDFANTKLAEFMGYQIVEEEDKYGRKGKQICTKQSNDNDEQPTGEEYKESTGGVPASDEEPESTDISFSDLIHSGEEDGREDGTRNSNTTN